jgi:hypothetical protein
MTTYESYDERSTEPEDPATKVAKDLLYGDSEDGGRSLRDFVRTESANAIAEREFHGRLHHDRTTSGAHINRFKSENSHWAEDPIIEAAMSASLKAHQRKDLAYDEPAFREKMGRDRSDTEVVNAHQWARVHGYPNVRSVEQLIEAAADDVERSTGLRRRIHGEDANRKRAVGDRINRTRNMRGLEPKQFDSNEFRGTSVQPSQPDDRGTTSLDSFSKLHDAGFGNASDAGTPNRKSGFLAIQAGRPWSRSKFAMESAPQR